MMSNIYDSIKTVKGIGEKKAQSFEKLGVFSLYDLITYFPRRYEDRTHSTPIAAAVDGEDVFVDAVVATDPHLTRIRKGLDLVKFKIADESGLADVTYFNQSYMKSQFSRGDSYLFFGKADVKGTHVSFTNPIHEKSEEKKNIGRIVPVYRLTSGITQKNIYNGIDFVLDNFLSEIPDVIPQNIKDRNGLIDSVEAIKNIHFPDDFESLAKARKRLIFEELFILGIALEKMHSGRNELSGLKISIPDMGEFFSSLAFTPTNAQINAINSSLSDMASGKRMSRLIQGDVGSGKTLVATALVFACHKSGYMSALMAPTEILAEQHYSNLCTMLSPFGIRVALLTGSSKGKPGIRDSIANGEVDLVIGTHALISDNITYPNLGLIVTDEQHRFGVEQRSALVSKGQNPHVLVMSATPIPRTLALIIYGDLDVSVIDELPPGRQHIDTYRVNSSYTQRIRNFIQKQCLENHQVYIVCPMVEENEENNLNLKSAEEYSRELQSVFPSLRIGCIHGKLKPAEKEKVMCAFVSGETDVLVSTTVIEVGVDVPNATLIIIENAERFGLSQLHQLRGRVGRGSSKSYCILVSDADNDEAKSRLDVLCKTNDGFKISEEDLRLRGPGDFFGNRQHGLPEMHLADLGADTKVLSDAKEEAEKLLVSDPELSFHTDIRNRIDAIFKDNTDRFN